MHGRRISGLVRRMSNDRRGYVTIVTAFALSMMIGAAALGVDLGSIYVAKRQLQGIADAAALASVNPGVVPLAAANAAIAANAATATVASLVPGKYTPDPTLGAAARFVANDPAANANRITLNQDVRIFFGRMLLGKSTVQVSATAMAARMDMASFSLGSRLAGVQGGLPGAMLSGLAGINLNLSVMDYTALAGADIDLLTFADALRTQLHLNAATFGATLDSTVTLPQALAAMASASKSADGAATLRSIALKLPPTTVQLSRLIDLGPLATQTGLGAANAFTFDAYSATREILALASGGRTASFATGLTLPGVTSTQLTIASGQRAAKSPWLTVTPDNKPVVQTAQTRLYLDATVGGTALLGLTSLRLPIFVELAQAQASLHAISCAGGQSTATVSVDVTPSAGEIAIEDIGGATFNDFTTPIVGQRVTMAHVPLVDVSGYADIKMGGMASQLVPFSPDDIAATRTKTVSTTDLMSGVASSLVGGLDLRVTALGFGLNLTPVTAAIGSALAIVAPTLDGVINQVAGLVGARIGQADVRIDGLRCGRSALVQ